MSKKPPIKIIGVSTTAVYKPVRPSIIFLFLAITTAWIIPAIISILIEPFQASFTSFTIDFLSEFVLILFISSGNFPFHSPGK